MDVGAMADRAVGLLNEALAARGEHRLDDALAAATAAANLFIHVDGPTSPDGANALMTAADVLLERTGSGDLAGAAERFDRAAAMLSSFGTDSGPALAVLTLRALRGTGTAARLQARYADAATVLVRALDHAEAQFGATSAEVGYVCNDLGVLGKFTASFDDAAQWYRRALEIVEATDGPRSAAAATLHHNLAGLAHSRQCSAEGLDAGRLSVEIRQELVGDDHVHVAADRANLGGLLLDVGLLDEAEACFEAARVTFERALGPDHLEVAIAWNNLAAVARDRGQRDRAEVLYRRALELKERILGRQHPSTLITVVNLAYLLSEDQEAIALLERAIEGLSGAVGEDDRTLTAARQGLLDRR